MGRKQKSTAASSSSSESKKEEENTTTSSTTAESVVAVTTNDENKQQIIDEEQLEKKEDFTINYLSLIDRYMNIYKNDLIPNIKNGFFNMSTTRLNMGSEYLGMEHIPNDEDILKSKIHLDSQSLEIVDFENVAAHFDKSLKEEEEQEKQLRNRKLKKNKEESTTTETLIGSKLEANYEEDLKKKNPIYWFGTITLSEDLVQAQSSFVNALKSVLELGKIVKELNELEKERTSM